MRRALIAMVITVCATAPVLGAENARLAESRGIVKEFQGDLKRELTAALQAGGPARAIEVCQVRAREIAKALAEKTGFRVGRTSSRLRNPRNSPDPWEKKVHQDFEARATKGQDVSNLEHHEVVDVQGKKVFRYMKAIPMADLCLPCHGERLAPDAEPKIREAYPKDRAMGFKVGEVRGAFTLSKPVE